MRDENWKILDSKTHLRVDDNNNYNIVYIRIVTSRRGNSFGEYIIDEQMAFTFSIKPQSHLHLRKL